jgi:multidrug efflux pump subunit AcrB
MNGLIRASLGNPYAVTVAVLTIVVLGSLTLLQVPKDILPVSRSPAVQVLTFYGGMSASNVEKDITSRMERWTGQAAGTQRQESRSIVGASIIRNYYRSDIDPNGALTQVNSLASAAIPNLPPGTLPPVILPFDPTGTTPVCLIALDSKTRDEAELYDTGRYEVRNMIMGSPGAVAPVVYGGRLRAVIAYLNREQLQARHMSPVDVMAALDRYNIFLPTGSAKFGNRDWALDSNSMYELVEGMRDIPLRTGAGRPVYLGDVATPKDSSLIQTNLVRVDGRRQVYIPVYRQVGSSTLNVVDNLKDSLPEMKAKLTLPDIDLKLVMDQSVYVRSSIESLVEEGVLGAVLCSLVILFFLGEWRMTLIAVLTIPISVLAAIIGLHYSSNTINVMTLAGLSLAIGPLVDSAIICLENTHRHLELGAKPRDAAFFGASEVAMPELVASCCTLLVLAPLAFMPGLGVFLFRPMALAVAFSMIAAYLLSRSFVPMLCCLWLRTHSHPEGYPGDEAALDTHVTAAPCPPVADAGGSPQPSILASLFARWELVFKGCIAAYVRLLEGALKRRWLILTTAFVVMLGVVLGVGSQLRREFFPEVDAGAFEIQVRTPTGTRLEESEKRIAEVEEVIREKIGDDLDLIISELGVTPDWSAAYTPNSGPMDAVVKVQLKEHRERSAQQYVHILRQALTGEAGQGDLDETAEGHPPGPGPVQGGEPRFHDLGFAFDAGGIIRGAMNEGKSTPFNIQITGKDLERSRLVARRILQEVRGIEGVVDSRVVQRLNYPQYFIEVNRAKAASLGLTQADVMRNVVAAFNSSIQFNKRNFWIDPVSHNQYYVGVQYPEKDIKSLDTLLEIPITGPAQAKAIPLGNLVKVKPERIPAEVVHTNLQPTIDVTMGVQDRDLGHVADDVARVIDRFGKRDRRGGWVPYDPDKSEDTPLEGSKITLSGEYARMQDVFRNLGIGLVLAALLIYFLMVALFRSWVTPLVILSAVPVGLVGVVLMLYLTGTALNVQSLLGVIFMVGIVVSNTVLLVDFAQHLRVRNQLTPTQAIIQAAGIRVRPVIMTALAAFFALVPMALGLARGSEANTPLGRAVIGGLLAGLVTTLFVVPCLYSLVLPNRPWQAAAGEGETHA